MSQLGCQHDTVAQQGQDHAALRGRVVLCNCIGGKGQSEETSSEARRELELFKQFGRQRGKHGSCIEKELARTWFWRRQQKKSQADGPKQQAQGQAVCAPRQEARPCGERGGQARSFAGRCLEGPDSRTPSAATSTADGQASEKIQKIKSRREFSVELGRDQPALQKNVEVTRRAMPRP